MTLQNLYKYYHSHPESKWIMSWENTQLLYKFVREHPVKKILTLGTGIGLSDAVIALALKDKNEPQIDSINHQIDTLEPFEKCFKLAQELMPEKLKINIKFHRIDPIVWNTDKIAYQNFANFKEIPDNDYEMILVDGPGHWLTEDGHYLELPNGDVMKMLIEGKLKPNTYIVWDGRIQALKTLERYFSDNFYLIPEKGDFNVIQRKDNSTVFSDTKKETMKEAGYF